MANDVSVTTGVTTDPALLTGETYTKNATSITGTVAKGVSTATNMGLEILDGAGAVVRRKNTAIGAPVTVGALINATITGLPSGTAHTCRVYRGDVALADI